MSSVIKQLFAFFFLSLILAGLAIAKDKTIDEAYRGIGIRIEDDILITDSQADVISKEVPKTVSEIEQLMKKA